MAGYWPSSFFASVWTEMESTSINSQKRTIVFYIQEKLTTVTATTATVCFVNSQFDYLLFLTVIGYFI